MGDSASTDDPRGFFIMKKIKLTQGKVAFVDDKDFEFLNQWKWHTNKIKGIWYAFRGIREPKIAKYVYGKVKRIAMHRVILQAKKGQYGDHKDGNGLNNQRYNIRTCTNSQNLRNSKKQKGTTSKYKGVSSYQEKWQACIYINGKSKWLGYFKTEIEAAIIYNITARRYYKDFANPNVFSKRLQIVTR